MVPLRDEPGGKALGLTAQGSHITLDERVTDWACVTSGDVQGWVVDSCVYRVPYDQVSTLKYVTGTEGANLRQTTWGEVITWLAAGSPVLPTGETQDGWVEVTLLDGTKGWVASHLIGSK